MVLKLRKRNIFAYSGHECCKGRADKIIFYDEEEPDVKYEIVTKHKVKDIPKMLAKVAVDYRLQKGVMNKAISIRLLLILLGTFALTIPPFLTTFHLSKNLVVYGWLNLHVLSEHRKTAYKWLLPESRKKFMITWMMFCSTAIWLTVLISVPFTLTNNIILEECNALLARCAVYTRMTGG